jgi:hypothetical protein
MSTIDQRMDAAREALSQAFDAARDDSAAYCTMETLRLRQATCYTEAGKPAKAAVLFGQVLAGGTLSCRDGGFFRARQATALALSGEPDEAAEVGIQALRTARETNSERTVRILNDTVQALAPWKGRPGPRALRQAMIMSRR